jgi:hypothetical protein
MLLFIADAIQPQELVCCRYMYNESLAQLMKEMSCVKWVPVTGSQTVKETRDDESCDSSVGIALG